MRARGLLLPLLLVIVADALCSRSALQLRRPPVLRLSGGSAPSEWSQHTTDDGRVYYYDSVSGTSMWTPPPELAAGDDHGTPEYQAAGASELLRSLVGSEMCIRDSFIIASTPHLCVWV